MIAFVPGPWHGGGVAGHDWGYQILVLAIVGGLWLLAAGLAERAAARRRGSSSGTVPPLAMPRTIRRGAMPRWDRHPGRSPASEPPATGRNRSPNA